MEFTSRRRLLFGINLFYFSAAISISFFFLLFAFPGNLKGEPVPDTGQKTCWDEEGNIIECRAPGSPLYGQDANYNINAPSFTKLDTD